MKSKKNMKKTLIITILGLTAFFRPVLAETNQLDSELNLKVINKFIKDNPKDPNLYFVKGQILTDQNRFRSAEKAFQNVIALYPAYDEAYFELARLQNELGDLENAFSNIQKYLSLNPEDISAIILLGRIQYFSGNFESAIFLSDQALNLDSYNGKAYLLKGEVYYETEDYESAYKNWQLAMDLGEIEAELHIKYLFKPVW